MNALFCKKLSVEERGTKASRRELAKSYMERHKSHNGEDIIFIPFTRGLCSPIFISGLNNKKTNRRYEMIILEENQAFPFIMLF